MHQNLFLCHKHIATNTLPSTPSVGDFLPLCDPRPQTCPSRCCQAKPQGAPAVSAAPAAESDCGYFFRCRRLCTVLCVATSSQPPRPQRPLCGSRPSQTLLLGTAKEADPEPFAAADPRNPPVTPARKCNMASIYQHVSSSPSNLNLIYISSTSHLNLIYIPSTFLLPEHPDISFASDPSGCNN